MQLEDLNNCTEISNFWVIDELQIESLIQINVVFSPKPEKVVGLGRIEGKGYFLKSYDMAKRKLRGFKFDTYLKELGLDTVDSFDIVSIDKTSRTNKFVMSVQLSKDVCFVIEVKIATEGLTAVSSLKIDNDGFKKIGKLKTYMMNNSDFILCHGVNNLIVLKNDDKTLCIMSVLSDVICGNVLDSFAFRNKIFAVTTDINQVMEILCPEDDQTVASLLAKVEKELNFERFVIEKIEVPRGSHRLSSAEVRKDRGEQEERICLYHWKRNVLHLEPPEQSTLHNSARQREYVWLTQKSS